jgi:hypothetical protein
VTKRVLVLVVAAAGGLCATDALAFENQWHLGAGLGALSFANTSRYLVPAVSLHGAYGLSDMFDVRLEMGAGVPTSSPKSGSSLEYAEGVLAYKIDIVEWIPWVGLGAGVFGATSGFQGVARNAVQPAASFWLGLDYAFSRQWGVGGAFALHSWVADSERSGLRLAAEQFTLRIERRFGW